MMCIKTLLPALYGCHQRPERSFTLHGRSHLLCARCEGMLMGHILGGLTFFFYAPNFFILVSFMLPMIIDGMIQYKTAYESHNFRRLWTGFLFGLGSSMAVLTLLVLSYHLGSQVRDLLF